MESVTREDVRDMVRYLGQKRGGNGTGRHPDAYINKLIFKALRNMHDVIDNQNPRFRQAYIIANVSANVTDYDLTGSYVKRIESVDILITGDGSSPGTDEWYPITSYSTPNRSASHSSSEYSMMVQCAPTKIFFDPVITQAVTLRLKYLPDPADFADDTTALLLPSGAEDYLVYSVIEELHGRDHMPANYATGKINEAIARMRYDVSANFTERVRQPARLWNRKGNYSRYLDGRHPFGGWVWSHG